MQMSEARPRGRGARAPKAATIYDVARAAGVSHQTVSRYLTGFQGIRPETRSRVERAIEELKYRPNMTARSLKASRSHRIGALAYDLHEVGPSKTVQAASEAARKAGYVLDIVSLDPTNVGDFASAIALLNQSDFAGIMAGAPTDELRAVLDTAPFAVPVVLETEEEAGPGVAETPSIRGMRMLTEHLIELGHRRIVHLAGPQNWVAARNRAWGYRRTMEDAGLHPQQVDGGGWSAAGGYAALMCEPHDDDVTAYVAANDHLALGALQALHQRGRSVPADVSVVGFDDVPEAAYFLPPLTTIHQDYDALGRSWIHALLDLLGEPHAAAPDTSVITLVQRASSGVRRRS